MIQKGDKVIYMGGNSNRHGKRYKMLSGLNDKHLVAIEDPSGLMFVVNRKDLQLDPLNDLNPEDIEILENLNGNLYEGGR